MDGPDEVSAEELAGVGSDVALVSDDAAVEKIDKGSRSVGMSSRRRRFELRLVSFSRAKFPDLSANSLPFPRLLPRALSL